MTTVYRATYKVVDALERLSETDAVRFAKVGSSTHYIDRIHVWGRYHAGMIKTRNSRGELIEWLNEGIEIVFLDDGVHIYQETRTGTQGEITLKGEMVKQEILETVIKQALEGIK